jgi:alkanesulfonate monooxygenase SsuD/methylene tetrahydromethanopterin reductase-like flavin-dependent oxidoreductase (luciferase family)
VIDPGRSLGQRLDWLDESLTIIGRILAGGEVTHQSDHYHFNGVHHAPLPLRPKVPVIVGATGEKKGLRIVARHADLWQFWSPMDSVAEFQRLDGVLRGHCDAVGRDEREIRRLAGAKVVIRPTRAEADRVFERQLEVQPWSGEVLAYIRDVGLWRSTPAQALDAIGALQAAGAGGFIAQVYPPYDHDTIERLATDIAPQLGWQPQKGTGHR